MSELQDLKIKEVDADTAVSREYDLVIVGAGISGAILANELGKEGYNILILEAGPGRDMTMNGYQENYLETFYADATKDNQSPYKRNPNAEMPRSPDLKPLRLGQPNTDAYWVQNGPFVSDSTYTRVLGGTTMHWEGKMIRMLRDDFKMKSIFGHGLDWPIDLDEIMPYYRTVEKEVGVAGNVGGQIRSGVEFEPDYVYPMHEMPPSYLDKCVAKHIDKESVELDGKSYSLRLETFPQGRNGIPNKDYEKWNDDKPFVPQGAVSMHQAEEGERCQGNTNCVPLCPVQAKYDSRKTLIKAIQTGNVEILPKAVASVVNINNENGRVKSLSVKVYKQSENPEHQTITVKGKIFVLAANAVETARIMLASGLNSTSGLVGKNLMDHAYILCWGMLPDSKLAGVGRGPVVTSGITHLRNGSFRKKQAAFSVDIHNEGWGWATGGPMTNLANSVDERNKFGKDLRETLVKQVSNQLLLASMVELIPETRNKVTVDPSYTDALGNMRPVVTYNIPEYSMHGVEYARQLSSKVFQLTGSEEFTKYDPLDYGYVNFNGQNYAIRGGNHIAGTHIMGLSKNDSVVDSHQKSWDHENLYLVGAGSMPTIGSANTTLTLAALCYRTVERIKTALLGLACDFPLDLQGCSL